MANFCMVYPEQREISEERIRARYTDAVANGNARADITNILDIINELEDTDNVTFSSRGR